MTINRIVNTSFWINIDVLDKYSVEDKFFSLYLATNPQTTQLGIYQLPLKKISFETGFTIEVVRVLLDRFENKYEEIIYHYETQEIALLNSLKTSIIRGGTPVTELLKKEINRVQNTDLITATYEHMRPFWNQSSRPYDATIESVFVEELQMRGIQTSQPKVAPPSVEPINENSEHSSVLATPLTDDERQSQDDPVEYYAKTINPPGIGDKLRLNHWQKTFPNEVINEAIKRSVYKEDPFKYMSGILFKWKQFGIKNLKEVEERDLKYLQNKLG